MVGLSDTDIKVLTENFDVDLIKEANPENIYKILVYLKENGIDYTKDLFCNALDLFLNPSEIFIEKFENLKKVLGPNFADKLGDDFSLIEIMYED